MAGFGPFLRKELLEQWRTLRIELPTVLQLRKRARVAGEQSTRELGIHTWSAAVARL